MEKIKRISISVPEVLFNEFEKIREEIGERKRSRAVAEALYEYISVNEWIKLEGEIAGVIVVHSKRNKEMDFLFEIEDRFSGIVKSCFHARMDSFNYLWMIVFRGDSKKIKEMAKEISRRKCIKTVRIFTVHA